MANIFTIAGKIEQARQVEQLKNDVEPLLTTALRLWQKLCEGSCAGRVDQAEAVRGILTRLEAAARKIVAIEEAGILPANGRQGNGHFKPVGRTGGEHDAA